jgi:hypothetical protein
MNKTQLVSVETLKTIGQGALGAMSFGAYHQYTTNRIMDLNNEKMNIQHKYDMDRLERQHKQEMDEQKKEMIDKLAKLEKMIETKRAWW